MISQKIFILDMIGCYWNALKMDIDSKALMMVYNALDSRPKQFIEILQNSPHANYRSPYWIDFNKFKPYKHFLVFFVKAGSNGRITSWGLANRELCKRVKSRDEFDSFVNLPHSLKGDSESEFRSVFCFEKISYFNKSKKFSDFISITDGKPITNLRTLRSPRYVEIPDEVNNEISELLRGVK